MNAKQIMKEGSFKLRNWLSNSVEPMNKINREENINCSDIRWIESYEKNFGYKLGFKSWHNYFLFHELVNEAFSLPMTKISILKTSEKILDPIGFTSPIAIHFKMLFQITCTNKFNWDNPLPNDVLKEWINLLEKLRQLDKLVIPKAILNYIEESEALRC